MFVLVYMTHAVLLRYHYYFILFFSLHGLIRGENMELGRDSDTGGQVGFKNLKG